VVIAVLNSAVSVYYYLRIVVAMYFRDASRPLAPIDSASMNAGLIITAIAVVLLGIFPGSIVDWAGPAVGSTAGLAVTALVGK
jgi:NADH-quinone oxidoreductase subunit N